MYPDLSFLEVSDTPYTSYDNNYSSRVLSYGNIEYCS